MISFFFYFSFITILYQKEYIFLNIFIKVNNLKNIKRRLKIKLKINFEYFSFHN